MSNNQSIDSLKELNTLLLPSYAKIPEFEKEFAEVKQNNTDTSLYEDEEIDVFISEESVNVPSSIIAQPKQRKPGYKIIGRGLVMR
ncbi:hypothetical protein RCL_jg23329.t1 [Rhizophagus clarus]|uniref:Uncharacterized protein n=1 Tax=Rhizophagus clarus TaxID=94130 RepID=A0A8H3L695_9GLOM|nr:hypothetical protein RCL_jg23329.t1 [Rhizophagus clarus]